MKRVNINGFSISGLKTMEGMDGMIIDCNLLFNDRKIGRYFNNGDGGCYSFWADTAWSREKIEKAVRSFPPIDRDYGYDLKVEWDIGILVEELIEKKKTLAQFRIAQKQDRDLIEGIDWRRGVAIRINIHKDLDDWSAETLLQQSFKRNGGTISEWHRYRTEEDINDSYVEITEADLK